MVNMTRSRKGFWPIEHFFKIRADKQEHIINAAFDIFGQSGYKKASVADIAARASIAKGMIAYYFGSKKNLYLYLMDLGVKVIKEKFSAHNIEETTDFFEQIKRASLTKVEAMRVYPGLMSFLASVFTETDKEVAEEVREFIKSGSIERSRVFATWASGAEFREGVSPALIDRFLRWAAFGMIKEMQEDGMENYDVYLNEFFIMLDIIKESTYKEAKHD